MRRVLVALVAAAVVFGAIVLAGAGGQDGYRVNIVFDNSDFLVPGQDVKIAGAKVGTIDDVTLTPDRHAQVEALITDPGFAPFRANADCTVQLQSLIGERFVECFPGSLPAKALPENEDGVATVPLQNTHSPVDLDLVLSAFKAPAPERLALLLSSLGAGTAGRGDDLNTIIRRAAPALQQSTRLLTEVNRNRDQLRSLISDGNTVMAQLDAQKESLAQFVHATGDLSGTLADRRAQLAATIRDLPNTLEALNPYLDTVAQIARQTQPTLDSLDAAAGPLDGLLTQLDHTSDTVQPALGALRQTADDLRAAVPAARPVVGELSRMARATKPAASLASRFFTSLHDQGAIEGAQRFLYFAVAATARFDSVSHILGAYPIVSNCSMYSTTPTAACYTNFPGAPVARSAPQTRKPAPHRTAHKPRHKAPAAAVPAAPAPTVTPAPNKPLLKLPALPGGLDQTVNKVQTNVTDLLNFLLK
jgi:phospholipid/cholesterol/gamma-HCH transport system substrate-binding protein